MTITSVVIAASYLEKANYPSSGNKGVARIGNNIGSYPYQSWWGWIESKTFTNSGGSGPIIGNSGRDWWSLSTMCNGTATDFESLAGANNSPGNSYYSVSPALLTGNCPSGPWYAYATAQHNFNSSVGGDWDPQTDAVLTWR